METESSFRGDGPVRVLFGYPAERARHYGAEARVGYLEELAIAAEVTGSHAGWQLALAERHGGILGVMWDACIQEHAAAGKEDMKKTLACAVLAKNSTITRNGYTPDQAVFGHELRFPGGNTEDDDEFNLAAHQALGQDGEVARAAAMRHSAKIALMRLDVQDKMRRAIVRGPPNKNAAGLTYLPGTRIYFWQPAVGKPRVRRDPGRWRGPALVITKERKSRYFVSWHGRCLLLAAENIRPASAEEAAMYDLVCRETDEFQDNWKEDEEKRYEDQSNYSAPPAQDAKDMMRGMKTVKKLMLKDKLVAPPKKRGRPNKRLPLPPPSDPPSNSVARARPRTRIPTMARTRLRQNIIRTPMSRPTGRVFTKEKTSMLRMTTRGKPERPSEEPIPTCRLSKMLWTICQLASRGL